MEQAKVLARDICVVAAYHGVGFSVVGRLNVEGATVALVDQVRSDLPFVVLLDHFLFWVQISDFGLAKVN